MTTETDGPTDPQSVANAALRVGLDRGASHSDSRQLTPRVEVLP